MKQHFEHLEQVFDAFNKLKVLIIGDVMVDSYIWGRVERISPEAPVPIISINTKEIRLGGAANVAKNIAALGATPILCAVVGKDAHGDAFIDLLHQQGISGEGIVSSNLRPTTVKERVLSGSQHILRIDNETDHLLYKEERKQLLENIERLLPDTDVVIFEDYDKGVIDKKLIAEVVEMAKTRSIPVAVDPKKRNFMDYRGVTIFKPNLKEIKEGLKVELDAKDDEALKVVVEKLMDKLGISMALITRSERGVYIHAGTESHFLPAHIRSVSDVSGAGDTVISTASLCLALGLAPIFIASLSNLAGGLVCEHLGVVPIEKDKLFAEASEINLANYLNN